MCGYLGFYVTKTVNTYVTDVHIQFLKVEVIVKIVKSRNKLLLYT